MAERRGVLARAWSPLERCAAQWGVGTGHLVRAEKPAALWLSSAGLAYRWVWRAVQRDDVRCNTRGSYGDLARRASVGSAPFGIGVLRLDVTG